jgi:hypothetical protein
MQALCLLEVKVDDFAEQEQASAGSSKLYFQAGFDSVSALLLISSSINK